MTGTHSNVPPNVPAVPAHVPAPPTLNQRQEWVLEQLEQGIAVQRIMVEDQFGVGDKTAKRDLSELVQLELIEYERQGRDGYYRLAKSVSASP